MVRESQEHSEQIRHLRYTKKTAGLTCFQDETGDISAYFSIPISERKSIEILSRVLQEPLGLRKLIDKEFSYYLWRGRAQNKEEPYYLWHDIGCDVVINEPGDQNYPLTCGFNCGINCHLEQESPYFCSACEFQVRASYSLRLECLDSKDIRQLGTDIKTIFHNVRSTHRNLTAVFSPAQWRRLVKEFNLARILGGGKVTIVEY
jgi:hypothetical protein